MNITPISSQNSPSFKAGREKIFSNTENFAAKTKKLLKTEIKADCKNATGIKKISEKTKFFVLGALKFPVKFAAFCALGALYVFPHFLFGYLENMGNLWHNMFVAESEEENLPIKVLGANNHKE